MAIRPVDLQLAYLASPINAAVASSAQKGPQVAQEAAQLAFADEVRRREESVAEAAKTERDARIHPDADGGGQGGGHASHRDAQSATPESTDEISGLGLAPDGEHFIDVVA